MAEQRGGSTLFVGTQTKDGSKGIYAYRWDGAKGEITLVGLAAEAEWIETHRKLFEARFAALDEIIGELKREDGDESAG